MTERTENNSSDADWDRYFQTEHLTVGLKGRAVRSGAATLVAQGCQFVLQFGSLMTLARLLRPEDFGLVAMATAVTGFVAMFKDMGLSTATIQQDQINHGQVSTLFWVNVGTSVLLGVLIACLAWPLAWFYGDPRVAGVTLALALGMLVSGLGLQHRALMHRQMRFKALAVVQVGAFACSVVVAVVAAWLGAGYWSLVLLPLTGMAVSAAGMWLLCSWRPGRPVRHAGVRPMLRFGGYLAAFDFVNYFARNLDNILIGKFIGSAPLGLYTRAYSLLLLPINQINGPMTVVALPVLSRLVDNPDRYRLYYRQGMALIVMLGMPLVAFMFVTADDLVLLVLGSQWSDAVSLFRALGPAAFLGTFNVASSWVLISLGKADRRFRVSLFSTAAMVVGFAIGLQWGVLGVAVAVSVVHCVIRIPALAYCFHGTPVSLKDLGSALWRPAAASITAGIALAGVESVWAVGNTVGFRLAFELILYVLMYLLVWTIQPGGVRTMKEMLNLASSLRRQGSKGVVESN